MAYPASKAQLATLREQNIPIPEGLTSGTAARLILRGPPTQAQLNELNKLDPTMLTHPVTFAAARNALELERRRVGQEVLQRFPPDTIVRDPEGSIWKVSRPNRNGRLRITPLRHCGTIDDISCYVQVGKPLGIASHLMCAWKAVPNAKVLPSSVLRP